MTHGPELVDLYFGRDDAEMDIADGGLLRAGFLPTPAYEAARKARKHLIIGRKGSGKSAICRTLAAQEDTELVTRLVTPEKLKGSLKLQAFGIGVEVSGSSEGTRTDHQLEVVERHIQLAIEELACLSRTTRSSAVCSPCTGTAATWSPARRWADLDMAQLPYDAAGRCPGLS